MSPGKAPDWRAITDRIQESMRDNLSSTVMEDSPAYPLALNARMPKGHPYERGDLSLRFFDLRAEETGTVEADPKKCKREGELLHIGIVINGIRIAGKYSLDATPSATVDIDTGGNLQSLVGLVGAGRVENEPGTISPEKQEKFLGQAREQRALLQESPNGQKLLNTYGEHNEVYDEIFRKNGALRELWRKHGITAAMTEDTSRAVEDNTVVNRPDKIYGEGKGIDEGHYNFQAFRRQLAVVTACLTLSKDKDDKYDKAAAAAEGFSDAIQETTGNTKNKPVPMDSKHIRQKIDSLSGEFPKGDLTGLKNAMFRPGRIGALRVDQSRAGPAGRPDFNEEDLALIHRVHESGMQYRRAEEAGRSRPLWLGACGARVDGVVTELDCVPSGDGGAYDVRHCSVVMPSFDLDLDDSRWSGEAADQARERIGRTRILQSLLSERLAVYVKELIGSTLSMTEQGGA